MLEKPETAEREVAITALRTLIQEGGYAPGDRLPSERELIKSLEMTRSTLRRALETLERDGEIWRHVGKGTFVSGLAANMNNGGLAEICRQITPHRMLQARSTIEPAIAREAAMNASDESLQRIHLAMRGAEQAQTWADYEIYDGQFHRSVAQATENIVLLSIFDQILQIRRSIAWDSVVRETTKPPTGYKSFHEHAAIARAIEARSPKAAQDAMLQHIGLVTSRLFG